MVYTQVALVSIDSSAMCKRQDCYCLLWYNLGLLQGCSSVLPQGHQSIAIQHQYLAMQPSETPRWASLSSKMLRELIIALLVWLCRNPMFSDFNSISLCFLEEHAGCDCCSTDWKGFLYKLLKFKLRRKKKTHEKYLFISLSHISWEFLLSIFFQ